MIDQNLTPDTIKKMSKSEMQALCQELRSFLIDEIAEKKGGHIGVNLGVVELTVALHRVFDTKGEDLIIWDPGHNIYVHRMVTARVEQVKNQGQDGGSPAYLLDDGSGHDFVAGTHAGYSVAMTTGIAEAKLSRNETGCVISVIGDGTLGEGCILEALNGLAQKRTRQIIVINDNEMALDKNYGGLHEYLKSRSKEKMDSHELFDLLGIATIGPVDGHDLNELVQVFGDLKKNITRPTIVHVRTVKGKGLDSLADNHSTRLHWTFPLNTRTGETSGIPSDMYYPAGASRAVEKILTVDPESLAITPGAMQTLMVNDLLDKFPGRFIDVAMAEQYAVTLAAGYALAKKKPIICAESTFMIRTFDQIFHDICLNRLPVLMLFGGSGHGKHHFTHHGLVDINYLRTAPGLRLVYADRADTLYNLVINEYRTLTGPTVILYPADFASFDPPQVVKTDRDFVDMGSELVLLACGGKMATLALNVCKLLEDLSISAQVTTVTEIEPLNKQFVDSLGSCKKIVTFEDSYLTGGFGTAIWEALNMVGQTPDILRIGYPKDIIPHGSSEYIQKKYQLDPVSVVRKIHHRWGTIFKDAL